ncbi:MAG: response regulator transcription factor [Bacillota bacterium]
MVSLNLNDKKILLIEDDTHIYELLKAMLKSYNTTLIFKKDGETGLNEALTEDYDLILLDIMLPKKDGWEICQKLKQENIPTPIIMLTAKAEETDKVLGLEMGADDYVTKPFSPRELTARMKAVMRRFENSNQKNISKKMNFPEINLTIDIKGHIVYTEDSTITLAPKEFELFLFLAKNQDEVFSRKELLNEIWGYENKQDTRTVDEHVKRIRKKLTDSGLKKIPLKTVWGVGYKFEI